MCNDILFICAALTNLQPLIVSKNTFDLFLQECYFRVRIIIE